MPITPVIGAKENAPDAQARNVDSPQRFQDPHRINTPLSFMGQNLDAEMGNPVKKVDQPLKSSPMTESSLDLLGAGTPYGGNMNATDAVETNSSLQGKF